MGKLLKAISRATKNFKTNQTCQTFLGLKIQIAHCKSGTMSMQSWSQCYPRTDSIISVQCNGARQSIAEISTETCAVSEYFLLFLSKEMQLNEVMLLTACFFLSIFGQQNIFKGLFYLTNVGYYSRLQPYYYHHIPEKILE